MKIKIISDLHLDFYLEKKKSKQRAIDFVVSTITEEKTDLLVIAGDLTQANNFHLVYDSVQKIISSADLTLYVPGNHEYYCLNFLAAEKILSDFEKDNPSLVILNNRVKNIDGINFVGTTLWFEDTPQARIYASKFNDFKYIKGSYEILFEEGKNSLQFLRSTVNENSVVITHHTPCMYSIPQQYKYDLMNPFFLYRLENFIIERNPKLWIHGHTHSNMDYVFNNTRIVCNPKGYPNENDSFNPYFILEI